MFQNPLLLIGVGAAVIPLVLHLLSRGLKLRIVDRLHRSNRVNCCNLGPTSEILEDDIARQHSADLVLDFQRFVGKRRIARAEDDVRPKVHIDLGLERILDIDTADYTEALLLKSGFNARDCLAQ